MSVGSTQFGVALPLEGRLSELVASARHVEELGYQSLWANDDRLGWDPFMALAAFADATERIHLGPGVTNPYSRHPGLITTACASLDALSNGRAMIGLGAGGTNHRALGVERRSPLTALRESIGLIRDLLAGRSREEAGRIIPGRDLSLGFEPLRPEIPIHIGARGPKLLELGGEIADGVIVGNVTRAPAWNYALDRIKAGAERAKRSLSEIDLTAWMYTSIADDSEAAIEAVRPMAATSLVTSRAVLADMQIEMPADFAAAMEAAEWRLDIDSISAPSKLLPVEVVRSFSLAGTAVECRSQLSEMLRAFPEIGSVVIVPFAPAGEGIEGTVSSFIEEVAKPEQEAEG